MAKRRLQQLTELGQSVWIDSLFARRSRERRARAVDWRGLCEWSHEQPTIFQKALAEGDWYDSELRELASLDKTSEIFFRLAENDVRGLRHPAPYPREDGRHRRLRLARSRSHARLRQRSTTRRLCACIARSTVPTCTSRFRPPAGLPAIEDAIAAGHSVNITLIFSLQRYTEVVDAYLRGLERRVAGAGDVSQINSVASFFVSRVDSEADKRLEAIGSPEALALRASSPWPMRNWPTATTRRSSPASAGSTWSRRAPRSALPLGLDLDQEPAYPDTLYVSELIGPDTVNTMPIETVRAFQDHGTAAVTLTQGVEEAKLLLEQIEAAGVSYDEVVDRLEAEGVQKFADSSPRY